MKTESLPGELLAQILNEPILTISQSKKSSQLSFPLRVVSKAFITS